MCGERRTQARILRLQFFDLGFNGGKCLLDFSLGETRDDVRGTVHVPRFDGEKDGAFRPGFVALVEETLDECRVILDDACASPEFNALPPRGVEQE